jgi:hypothetical protein
VDRTVASLLLPACPSPSWLLFDGDDGFVNHIHSMSLKAAGHIPVDHDSGMEWH